ncbi:MAG: hypothetical protein LBF95_08445, partial [Treponema sp.]|nr:hypothetical protein [Treponema sp.]
MLLLFQCSPGSGQRPHNPRCYARFWNSLSFEFEYLLNSEPLRIDAVIIRKKPGTRIDIPIGAMFRLVNIVEYKSPGDYLSLADYQRVGAYARLYSAREGTPTRDMTITFVVGRYPRKLISYLRNNYGYEVKEEWPGIHYIRGDIFGMQVVESGKARGEGGWLKDLRGGLNGEQLKEIIERGERMPRGTPISAYMYMVIQANAAGAKEMAAMSGAALEKVMRECGFIEKWETEGMEKGLERGLQKG